MDVETCRICANFYVTTSEVDFIDLFQPAQETVQRELNFIINELNTWQLNILPNDGLPQRICANCFTKFCTIDGFRQECEAAQNLLRRTLERQLPESNADQTTMDEGSLGVHEKQGSISETVEPIIQDTAENNLESLQLPSDVVVIPPEVVINYNVSYVDNIPTNFVISEADSVVDKNVVVASPEIQINSKKAIVSNKLPEIDEIADLEEMLKGSIIPKNKVNGDVTKPAFKRKATSQINSFEDFSEIYEEEDCFDEKPAQRLANFSFACNYCYCPSVGPIGHLIFKNNEALSQHFFDVHDPKLPFPCPKCPKLFLTNRRRNEHVAKVHDIASPRMSRCPFCHRILRTPLDLHENSCTYISNWKCHVCERDFRQMPLHSFRAHQRTHYLNPKFRCEVCKQDFMRRTTFEAHQKTHASKYSKSRDFCIECGKSFDSYDDLKDHEWAVHNGKALFRCKHCDKGYSSIVFLKRHMSKMHSDETLNNADETTCSICSITFPSKLKLYYHQQRPKDENGKCILLSPTKTRTRSGFTCPHCSKYFPTKEQLSIHLETHDERLRPYACNQCTVRCRTDLELKEHVEIAHFNTEAFSCEQCGDRFGYRKDLEEHKLYHSKLTFKCSLERCNAIFANEEELSQHICSNHEPVPCEYCGEIFTRNELKVHQNGGTCLTPLNNANEASNVVENKLNTQGSDINHQIQPTDESNISKANVCVQYVDQQPNSIVLKDDITSTPQPKQNVLDFLQSDADGNIFPAPDVPLNEDDYFISSLLDPDNEIVVA